MSVAPVLLRLALATLLVALSACASIGSIRVLGSYITGEGSDRRELAGAIEIGLRDAARRPDGKTTILPTKPFARLSPAEPACSTP